MQKKRLLMKIGAGVSAAVGAAAVGVVGTAGPAAAGGCANHVPYCGGTVTNLASSSIAITNCWNGTIGAAFIYRETLTCASNGWTASNWNAHTTIGPRSDSSSSYYYYDTDGFRVLRGCRVVARWNGGGETVYNRQGSSTSMWVKVGDGSFVSIVSYTC
ncbi:hypothetical protein Aab01nite_82620 [Paractinoplanes abujensis]|uniref:Uncharacterized protein n=1 Tax=Paractinoplanes abujensis TaxID=882441 RepID=A0A7W7CJZ3_9ACTN|nr:hypothetical protein [Actinoplanes abujensis]MBB4689923.1 hypothetical protein [Actinoplanes abujensis]GID24672.1 hypothetical protein Aab01nite_82620 [Actinoplanes abujensis]